MITIPYHDSIMTSFFDSINPVNEYDFFQLFGLSLYKTFVYMILLISIPVHISLRHTFFASIHFFGTLLFNVLYYTQFFVVAIFLNVENFTCLRQHFLLFLSFGSCRSTITVEFPSMNSTLNSQFHSSYYVCF